MIRKNSLASWSAVAVTPLLENKMTSNVQFHPLTSTTFERCRADLPPHSKTQARNGEFMVLMHNSRAVLPPMNRLRSAAVSETSRSVSQR
jgi:hypothetical protein